MSENAISIEILSEQYKYFCYLPGRSFDRDPSRDITKMIYQADLGITPGMFTFG
jgi:flagellar protein FlaJ